MIKITVSDNLVELMRVYVTEPEHMEWWEAHSEAIARDKEAAKALEQDFFDYLDSLDLKARRRPRNRRDLIGWRYGIASRSRRDHPSGG